MQLLGVGKTETPQGGVPDVELSLRSSSINVGNSFILTLKNNLDQDLVLENDCPNEPLDVFAYDNGEWTQIHAKNTYALCEDQVLLANTTLEIPYGKWKQGLFSDLGQYKIVAKFNIDGVEKEFFKELQITNPGFFKGLWYMLFYKPIYNVLIFFLSVLPASQNLAIGIILLTLLIKLLLLVPNNKAIRAQKDLQKVQPMLEEVKKKYANDKKKVAEETMKIWKTHKVNPFGSCLPILIQFPIMIALFYVVKDGLAINENTHLLYNSLKDATVSIDPMFLWMLDLTKRNIYVLPFIVGGLQFMQMKLSFKKNKTKKAKGKEQAQMQTMNHAMSFILPIMIGVFTASLPAAVGIYWGTSTLFAVVQQYIIGRQSKELVISQKH